MDTPLIVYHSGDKGSAELMRLFEQNGIRYIARDIREDRPALVRIQKTGRNTVPQIFTGAGEWYGEYEQGIAYAAAYGRPELLNSEGEEEPARA